MGSRKVGQHTPTFVLLVAIAISDVAQAMHVLFYIVGCVASGDKPPEVIGDAMF